MVGRQQHLHGGSSRGLQPQPHRAAEAQRGMAAQAGQVIGQAHGPKGQRPKQRDEEPGGPQALIPQQGRLCHAGGCPAHAHRCQRAHHEAEAPHGRGGRGRQVVRVAVRLQLRGLRCLGLLPGAERPEQRHHEIPERRREEEPQR